MANEILLLALGGVRLCILLRRWVSVSWIFILALGRLDLRSLCVCWSLKLYVRFPQESMAKGINTALHKAFVDRLQSVADMRLSS